MLSSTLLATLFGFRLGLSQRVALSEHEPGFSLSRPGALAGRVVLFSLLVEAFGIALLWLFWERDLFWATFHSISAFCNAGFALPRDNLMGLAANLPANLALLVLMVLGSLGYLFCAEAGRWLLGHRPSLQCRLVLVSTIVLVVVGAGLFFLFEHGNPATLAGRSAPEQAVASIFGAVSPRTTGFYTVDYSQVREGTLLVTIVLMVIGGAPGSTAGGIKITTAVLLLLAAVAQMKGREDVVVWGRRVSHVRVLQSLGLAVFFVAGVLLLALALSYLEDVGLRHALFEAASAIGTTGLSTGITAELGPVSRLLVALGMFVGRVGPLTLAISLVRQEPTGAVQYPLEEVAIG